MVGRVVLLVRVAGFRLPVAGILTTAMFHRRCPDHGDVPSSWLRRGRCRACLVPVVRERQLGRSALAGGRRAWCQSHGSAGRSRTHVALTRQ